MSHCTDLSSKDPVVLCIMTRLIMRERSSPTGTCPASQTGPSPSPPHSTSTCVQADHWLTSTRQSILHKGWADHGRWIDGDDELRAPLYHQPWDAERIEEWHRVRSLIWHSLPAELSRRPEVIVTVGPDAPLCSDLHQVLEQIHDRLLWELVSSHVYVADSRIRETLPRA
jgi:hypothetical protein